jgi:hypothetical protein
MALNYKYITMQKVTHFVQAKRGRLFHDIQDPAKRTKHALGVNKKYFSRWIRESDLSETMSIKEGKRNWMIWIEM